MKNYYILMIIFVSQSKANNDLFEEFFEWKLKNFPTWAIKQGYHRYDNLMEDYSNDGIHQRYEEIKDFAQRSKDLKSYPGILMNQECQIFLNGFNYSHYYFPPINFLEGVQNTLPKYFKTPNYLLWNTPHDIKNNLNKLQKIPKFLNEILELLKEGSSKNISYPSQALDRTRPQFARLINQSPLESDFFTFFKNISKKMNGESIYEMEVKALKVIKDEVIPSFKRLNDYLMNEYVRRSQPGMSTLPNGYDRYSKTLQWHMTLNRVTPKEIHQRGLNEVEKLKKEFSEIIQKKFNSQLSVKDFFARVKSDPQYEFENEEEVLKIYKTTIHDTIWNALPKIFDNDVLKDPQIRILDIKASPSSAGGNIYYRSAAADGTRNGTVYINLFNLKNIKKYDILTLCLHEGNPGHHFNEAFLKAKKFPRFIQNAFYRGALSEAPSRLPVFTAYLEGWGLYSEYLGHEMGLYDRDPTQLIGFYNFNLLRAARCVVDTGIHSRNWTFDRARKYLMENTALSENYIDSELDRYITWPAQATTYKIGEMTFREIRQIMEQDFNLDTKTFHTYALSCLGPLDALQECIRAKIIATEESKLNGSSQLSMSFLIFLFPSLVLFQNFQTV